MTVGDLKRILQENNIPDDYDVCMGYFDSGDYSYNPNAVSLTTDEFYVDNDPAWKKLVLETVLETF